MKKPIIEVVLSVIVSVLLFEVGSLRKENLVLTKQIADVLKLMEGYNALLNDVQTNMSVVLEIDQMETKPVNWIGHPMVSNNDPYWPSQGWLPDYQIGFRQDNVVVWRKQ